MASSKSLIYDQLVFVYSCGLRLNEALNIEVSDIDRKRMVLHIHRGKGAKDRYVPLPHDTLKLLSQYWLMISDNYFSCFMLPHFKLLPKN